MTDVAINAANITAVRFAEQGGDPSTPASTFWLLYFKSDGVYIIDDAGSVTGPLAIAGASTDNDAQFLAWRGFQ